MGKLFTKMTEDFTCEVCQSKVIGKGYTNHCPNCLCSKHVDNNPGDRAANCGGIMLPIRIEKKGDDYIIVHKCQKCGKEKKNKSAPDDNFNRILEICKNTPLP